MPLDKVHMFPEEFNLLRKELHDNWPQIWKRVQWAMAFDGPLFIEQMNDELRKTAPFVFPTSQIKGSEIDVKDLCILYLDELRKRRGSIIIQ